MPARLNSKCRAGCILLNYEGKMLIVRNIQSGYWGFPKGHINEGETYINAAARELYEETGRILNRKLIVDAFNSKKSRLFLAISDFEKECDTDGVEIDEYQWSTLSELKKLPTSKFTQAFFNRIETALSKYHIYEHANPTFPT